VQGTKATKGKKSVRALSGGGGAGEFENQLGRTLDISSFTVVEPNAGFLDELRGNVQQLQLRPEED
jgi:hypothetical protein